MILVSACLLGVNCKYNGGHNLRPEIVKYKNSGLLVPVCPEELGGLPTPRNPAQFDRAAGDEALEGRSKIIDSTGKDVTKNFLAGAMKTLKIAREKGISIAVLKERSPSCGASLVYITEKGEQPTPGIGVTTALLEKSGIRVYSDEQFVKFSGEILQSTCNRRSPIPLSY